MESEKKFYRTIENGKICYRMVDINNKMHNMYYEKYKNCHLEFDNKELVPLDPDNSRSYGYKYNYKIVPDVGAKFNYSGNVIDARTLIGDTVSEIKDRKD